MSASIHRRSCILLVLFTLMAGCGEDDPPPSSPDDSSLIYACIRSTACMIQPYPRVADCVSNYVSRVIPHGMAPVKSEIYRCTNRSASCVETRSCHGAGSSCSASFVASCAGGRAVYCDLLDHMSYIYDCKSAGLTCKLDPQNGFAASCSGAASGGPPLVTRAACTDGMCKITGDSCAKDDLDRCRGNDLQACLDRRWVTFDCQALGLNPCMQQIGGWSRCSPPV